MSISITKNVSFEEWDVFCRNNHANVFQTPCFYQICKRAKYYDPNPFFAIDNERIAALILPVGVRFLPRIFDFMTKRIILYGGVLFDRNYENTEILSDLFTYFLESDKLPAHLFMEIRNFCAPDVNHPVLDTLKFKYYDYLNYIVDLTHPAEQLLQNMNSRKRQYIRRGDRTGFQLRIADSFQDVAEFYQILQKVYQRKGVPLADSSLFHGTFEEFNERDIFKILLVEYENKIIAGIAILTYNGVGYEWYVGSLPDYNSLHPNEWLLWETFKYLKEKGIHTFDFCGAGRPEENYGVRIFKKKFGGREVNYGRYFYTRNPRRYALMEKLYALRKSL